MVAVERTDNKIMALHGGENDKVRLDYTGVSRRSVTPVEGWESGRVRYHNNSVFPDRCETVSASQSSFVFLGSHL